MHVSTIKVKADDCAITDITFTLTNINIKRRTQNIKTNEIKEQIHTIYKIHKTDTHKQWQC